ncbi:unnamed protein product [Cyprideis torosa]|uniref:Uncharacterized protein n=1 Tax=Cyprideis torosa TaxID=163714 RepID=A0A7R8ZM68_9CRUS|nr:unnamed protein product [Cyprideis torosa]CAG0888204.1 unnamed protein product [Cyprideis torosa]
MNTITRHMTEYFDQYRKTNHCLLLHMNDLLTLVDEEQLRIDITVTDIVATSLRAVTDRSNGVIAAMFPAPTVAELKTGDEMYSQPCFLSGGTKCQIMIRRGFGCMEFRLQCLGSPHQAYWTSDVTYTLEVLRAGGSPLVKTSTFTFTPKNIHHWESDSLIFFTGFDKYGSRAIRLDIGLQDDSGNPIQGLQDDSNNPIQGIQSKDFTGDIFPARLPLKTLEVDVKSAGKKCWTNTDSSASLRLCIAPEEPNPLRPSETTDLAPSPSRTPITESPFVNAFESSVDNPCLTRTERSSSSPRLIPEKRKGDEDELVSVQLNATFTSELPPFDFDTDMNHGAIARAMAKEPWSQEYFQTLEKAHQTHYEQFGYLRGTVDVDGERHVLALNCIRDHSYGGCPTTLGTKGGPSGYGPGGRLSRPPYEIIVQNALPCVHKGYLMEETIRPSAQPFTKEDINLNPPFLHHATPRLRSPAAACL